MRALLTLAVAALASCCSPDAVPYRQVPEAVSEAAGNVWHVRVRLSQTDEKGETKTSEHTGTAFPLKLEGSKIVMMTAAHVFQAPAGVSISNVLARLGPTHLSNGRIMKRHPELDVATVEFHLLAGAEARVHELRDTPVRFGEILFVSGYPNGGEIFLTMGVASEPGLGSAAIYGGSSGSPVLDFQGRVVGVVSQIGVDPRGYPIPRQIPHKMTYVPIADI